MEVIKIIIKLLYHFLRSFFSRTTEKKILYKEKFEKYPSIMSEHSRIKDEKTEKVYLGIRVPFQTECRFSTLFADVLSGYEQKYFMSKSWARYFPDDRVVEESKAKNGFILMWTNIAIGTADLFPAIWALAKKLPPELAEIHSDGKHLRALLVGDQYTIGKIEVSKVRESLSGAAIKISSLHVSPAKRLTFFDRFPILLWLINCILFGLLIFLLILAQPHTNYIDSGSGDDVLFVIAGVTFLATAIFNWKSGFVRASQIGAFVTILSTLILLGAYLRVNDSIKKDGIWEDWKIASVKPGFGKYTKDLTGYWLVLTSTDKRWDKFFAKKDRLNGAIPKVQENVKMQVYKDLLGYHFADSVIYEKPAPIEGETAASENSIELLK